MAIAFNCFGGFSGDIDLSFDRKGNIALQISQSEFINEKNNTRNIGGIAAGIAGRIQFTNAETVYDLNGNSEYGGFTVGSNPYVGIDYISLPNARGVYNNDIDGFHLQIGYGVGQIYIYQEDTQKHLGI